MTKLTIWRCVIAFAISTVVVLFALPLVLPGGKTIVKNITPPTPEQLARHEKWSKLVRVAFRLKQQGKYAESARAWAKVHEFRPMPENFEHWIKMTTLANDPAESYRLAKLANPNQLPTAQDGVVLPIVALDGVRIGAKRAGDTAYARAAEEAILASKVRDLSGMTPIPTDPVTGTAREARIQMLLAVQPESMERNAKGAIPRLERAVALTPQDPQAVEYLAFTYRFAGRWREERNLLARADRLAETAAKAVAP